MRQKKNTMMKLLLIGALFACVAAAAANGPVVGTNPHQGTAPSNIQGRELEEKIEEGIRAVEFELEDGHAVVHVQGVSRGDVEDILWTGKSIFEGALDVSREEDSGLVFPLPADFRVDPAGVLEVRLNGGAVLVRGVPDDSMLLTRAVEGELAQASCATTSLFTARKCGGTTSAYAVPYRCCDNNYDGDPADGVDGNCVWLAWVRARENGWVVPGTWGNASNWCSMASRTPGWTVSSAPAVNTIACNASINHVAWVTAVNNTARTFTVTEQNCKVEPSCVGTGTRNKVRAFSTNWKFLRCSDPAKCGTTFSPIKLPGRFIRGVAYDSGTLWALHSAASVSDIVRIASINPVDGRILRESPEVPWNGRGITVAGGSLWIADALADSIRRVDPVTFAQSAAFFTPGTEPNGLAFDGSSLWLTDPFFQNIYRLSLTGGLLATFTIPNQGRTGLEWAGTGLWSNTGGAGLAFYAQSSITTTMALQGLSGNGTIYDVAFGGGKIFVSNGDTIDIQNWLLRVVPGGSRGTPTGALLKVGNQLSIAASGLVNTLPPGPGNNATPNGNGFPCTSDCILPSAPFGALIGRIGTGGQWFRVGASLSAVVSNGGQLYLAVNDTISDDNTGNFTASINWR